MISGPIVVFMSDYHLNKKLVSPSVLILCFLVVFFFYFDAISYDYVWDDTLLFVDKISLLNESLSWSVLVEPVLPGTTYMRPLVFLSFYVEFALFGQQPSVSHIVNLVLFSVNGFLIYLVSSRLSNIRAEIDNNIIACLGAVVYLVHPAVIEGVAWVSGRFDLFATLFILLGCYFFLLRINKNLKYLLVSGCVFLSLLSKELGIVLPGVIVCLWMYSRENGCSLKDRVVLFWHEHKWLLLLFSFVVALYFYLRLMAMPSVYHEALSVSGVLRSFFLDLLPFKAFGFYISLVLFPFYSIGPLHPASVIVQSTPEFWVGVLGLPVFCVWLVWGIFKGKSLPWLLLAAFLPLLLVLHIIPLSIGGTIGAERFLIAPLALLLVAVTQFRFGSIVVVASLRPQFIKLVLVVLGGFWLTLAMLLHHSFLQRWKSEVTLWSAAYSMHPEFQASKYNYLYSLITSGNIDDAYEILEKLRSENDGFTHYEQSLYADILVKRGNEESIGYLEGLIFSMPKFHTFNASDRLLSGYYMTAKQIGGVYSTYASALIIFKGDVDRAETNISISRWYLRRGEDTFLHYQQAAVHYLRGEFEEARMLLSDLDKLYFAHKNVYKDFFNILINKYCDSFSEQNQVCSRWSPDEWWLSMKGF